MIFKPKTGTMWDPSIIWHDGLYYAFMMYDKTSDKDWFNSAYCLLATSKDGVHWEEQGTVIDENLRQEGSKFYKCFVMRCGDKFIMDHGIVAPELGQYAMPFYRSDDLRNWQLVDVVINDDGFYHKSRWDHMYILPKQEDNPEAGYWGYIVAVAKEINNLPAMMESKDGIQWDILPPCKTKWGGY